MSVELITILMFASLMLLLATGLPVVFALGSVSVIFAYFLIGPSFLGQFALSMFRLMNINAMLAIPLFIFMGNILERSGVADDLYEMMNKWFGMVPGGLALGTILICTIFAAMSGISAAATGTMGLIALPAMLKRGYDKKLAVGCIMAGGGLGQLIPPSSQMIVWALWANESVGQMFIGGIIPGLILASLFFFYILIRCLFNRDLAPFNSAEDRASWNEKLVALKAVILPILIILGVLGSIFGGVATPTEAAAIGALGALISGAVYGRLNWANLRYGLTRTAQVTAMVMWIMTAGAGFASTFSALGGQQFVTTAIGGLELHPWLVIIMMQLIYVAMGCFLDANAIMMLSIPVFIPIVESLGFSTLWFGVLFMVNMELAFLTPPFGINLFYMKGVVPSEINMGDIYSAAIPFLILQAIALAICMIFPQTILFLAGMVG